jgi:hypothetical protein
MVRVQHAQFARQPSSSVCLLVCLGADAHEAAAVQHDDQLALAH